MQVAGNQIPLRTPTAALDQGLNILSVLQG